MDPVLLRLLLSSMVSDSVLVMLSRFSSIVFTEKSGFEVVSDVLLMAEDSLVGLHLDPDTFLSLALKSKGSAFTVFAFADASSSAADGNIFEGFFNFTLKSTTTLLLWLLLLLSTSGFAVIFKSDVFFKLDLKSI